MIKSSNDITTLVLFGQKETEIYMSKEEVLYLNTTLENSLSEILQWYALKNSITFTIRHQSYDSGVQLILGDSSSVFGKIMIFIKNSLCNSIYIEETLASFNNPESIYTKHRQRLIGWELYENNLGATIAFNRSESNDKNVINIIKFLVDYKN